MENDFFREGFTAVKEAIFFMVLLFPETHSRSASRVAPMYKLVYYPANFNAHSLFPFSLVIHDAVQLQMVQKEDQRQSSE
jgi:hypothetical protein